MICTVSTAELVKKKARARSIQARLRDVGCLTPCLRGSEGVNIGPTLQEGYSWEVYELLSILTFPWTLNSGHRGTSYILV